MPLAFAAAAEPAALRDRVRTWLQSGSALLLPGHDLRFLGAERPDQVRQRPELFSPSAWPIEKAGG